MLRFLTSLQLALLISPVVFAQTAKIDSLHEAAKKSSGKAQADLYLLAATQSRHVNADTSLYFANQALLIATREDYRPAEIHSQLARGQAYATMGKYALAHKQFTLVQSEARAAGIDSFAARAMMGIANCYWHMGKHAEAIELNFDALRLSEKTGVRRDIASAKTGLGMIYQTQEKLSQAEKYIREALDLLDGSTPPMQRLNALHTLANIYGMQGRIAEAMKIDESGISLARESGNEFALSLFYDNLANCFLFGDPPDYDKAVDFFNRTLLIDSSFGNRKQMSDSYKNLGMVFMTRNLYPQAIPYLERSIVLAREAGFVQGEQQGQQVLSTLYKLSGEPLKAYETLRESNRLKDSLVNSTREARIAELETFYETEKQKQTIALQETELSRKNAIIAGTIITALLLGLLGYSLYRRYKLKQKSRLQTAIMNQQELATKAVIEAEEKERQRIARDLHDGVGQMMSAAKMNLSAFEAELKLQPGDQQFSLERIVSLVDESCREIREVSHNMVPNALLKHSLAAAVQDFLDKIDKKSLSIHLYTEGLDQRLDFNTETVLYRVIQECVNNVIKHAQASSLDISIIRDNEGISASIEDNGKGFDPAEMKNSDGIGLENIRVRIEYLKGTIDIDAGPGRGTMIGLFVPLSQSPARR